MSDGICHSRAYGKIEAAISHASEGSRGIHVGCQGKGQTLESLERPRGSKAPPGYLRFSASGSACLCASAPAMATNSCNVSRQINNIHFESGSVAHYRQPMMCDGQSSWHSTFPQPHWPMQKSTWLAQALDKGQHVIQ